MKFKSKFLLALPIKINLTFLDPREEVTGDWRGQRYTVWTTSNSERLIDLILSHNMISVMDSRWVVEVVRETWRRCEGHTCNSYIEH
jgi:hypothetical protein